MNEPSYFEIQANDLKRASNFYGQIFGWKFIKAEGLPVEYWRIETQGPRGGLLKRPAQTPPPQSGTNAFVCSMQVESFDAVASRVTKLGGQVALPKFAAPEHAGRDILWTPRATRLAFMKLMRRRSEKQ